jgi:Flp pilus assembly protein TadB
MDTELPDSDPMAKSTKKKVSHFTWPDAMVLCGAALMLAAAIYEGNWFFLSLGVAIVAVIGVRVLITQWLVKQHLNKK